MFEVRCPISFFFFSSRRRHTRWNCDWSSDVCSSDLHPWGVKIEPRLFLFSRCSFCLVYFLPFAASLVIITCERDESRIGDSIGQQSRGGPQERIAALNMVFKER